MSGLVLAAGLALGNLAAGLDTSIPAWMEEQHVPGMVIVVVDPDHTLYARGFGVADLESRAPVDPVRTTFRVASVTKLFTATAAMQQVERGRLSLDDDVNATLHGVRVPEAFAAPVTLRHLLTHTAGFGAHFLGSRGRTRADQLTLEAYLAGQLPRRFAAPGRVFSYANHGMALAGHLVASVDGRRFPDYLRDEVLAPLDMSSSGVGMEPELVERLASAYVWVGGRYFPVAVDYRNEIPSGSLITTGRDMARFLRAHLNRGELEGRRILATETADAMHAPQFSPHPRLGGVGYGFLHRSLDGRRFIGHDGDITGWNARAWLEPELGLGIFVAHTGTDSTKRFADRVTRRILEAVPSPPQPAPLPARAAVDLARYAGTYRWTRQIYDGREKIAVPYHFVEFTVRTAGDGLEVAWPLGFLPAERYVPVAGEHLFERPGSGDVAAFLAGERGEISHLLLSRGILMSLARIPFWATAAARCGTYLAFLLLFAAGAVAWLARGLHGASRSRNLVAAGVCGANALFLTAFPVALGLDMYVTDVIQPPLFLLTPGQAPFFYGLPGAAAALLPLPPLALAGAAGLTLACLRPGAGGRRSAWALLVASAALVLHLGSWDLLPWS